jgi:hypothetical protein
MKDLDRAILADSVGEAEERGFSCRHVDAPCRLN